jgi:hypothetical protein
MNDMNRSKYSRTFEDRLHSSRPRLGARHRASRAGLGLVEVICATLIVGIMLVASLETVGAVFRTQRLNADRLIGPNLTMELMTEVLSTHYEDPEIDNTGIGREVGELAVTRAHFDDVDDYHGWNKVGAEAKDGTPNASFSTWRRQVNVVWVKLSDGTVSTTNTQLKRITVTVTSPTGDVTQLSAYRAKDGMLEQSPWIEMTAVTWLGAKLQLGAGNLAASVGTNLTNHATDAE